MMNGCTPNAKAHNTTEGGRIKVSLLSDRLSIVDRLRVSSGLARAGDQFSYAQGAFIPAEPWHTLTPEWRSRLSLDQPPRGVISEVLIVAIPTPVVATLHALGQREDEGHRATPQEMKPVLNSLLTVLRRDITFLEPLHWLGFRSTHDTAPTATWDAARNQRPGLHIDSWDKVTVPQRQNATNRICLNLGPQIRSFLFLDIAVTQMPDLCAHAAAAAHTDANVDLIADSFLSEHPGWPVVRVDVAPGEAYIAPTELLIHDGLTADALSPNRTFALRGHFRARIRSD